MTKTQVLNTLKNIRDAEFNTLSSIDKKFTMDKVIEFIDKDKQDDYTYLILKWAKDRDLLKQDPHKQFTKLLEEVGELAKAILTNDKTEQLDAVGDIVVVLTILSNQLGFDIDEAVKVAYKEIKDRKGKTINGVFVKE